jgi:PAS domain S-box-containing protein
MHKLLEQQIIEHFGSLTDVPNELRAFLLSVNKVYRRFETDRSLDDIPSFESARRYRDLFELSPDAIYVSDLEGYILDANPAACRLQERSREELIGKHFLDFVPASRKDSFNLAFLQDNPEINSLVESYCFTKEGKAVPVEIHINQIEYSGKPAVLLHVRDISERHKAQEQFLLQETALQSAANGIIITNHLGSIIWANASITTLTGYTQEDLIGENPRLLKSGEHGPEFYKNLWETISSGNTWNSEITNRRKDGTLYTEEMTITPIVDHDDKVTHYIAIKQDITPRKKAEEKLIASEQRYRTLIENTNDFIAILDAQGTYLYTNSAVTRILGYNPEELIGRDAFEYIHPEDLPNIISIFHAGGKKWNNHPISLRFRHLEGTWTHLEAICSNVSDEQGEQVVYITARDISERIEFQNQLEASFNRRSQQVAFVTDIAQDIATAKDMAELYQRIVTLIKEKFSFYHTQLFRFNPVTEHFVLVAGYGRVGSDMVATNYREDAKEGLFAQAVEEHSSIILTDVRNNTLWKENPHLPYTQSEIISPIYLGNQLLGILDAQSDVPGIIDDDIRLVFEVLCSQIAVAIESIRLRTEMEERLRELSALQQMTTREGWSTFQEESGFIGYRFDPTQDAPVAFDQISEKDKNTSLAVIDETDHSAYRSLEVRGEIIGSLGIELESDEELSEEELTLLDSISIQVAEALDRARLFEASQRSASELSILNEMATSFTEALDENAIIENLYNYASQLVDTDDFAIALLDHESNRISFPLVVEDKEILTADHPNSVYYQPRDASSGLTGHLITDRKPILIQKNVHQTLEEAGMDYKPHAGDTASWLGVPMIIGDRILGGIIMQSDHRENLFNHHDVGLLTAVASQAATALENARLFTESQRSAQELAILNEMGSAFTETLDVMTVVENIHRYASRLIHTDNFLVALYDSQEELITLPLVIAQRIRITSEHPDYEKYQSRPADYGLIGHIIRTRQSTLIDTEIREHFQEMGISSQEITEPIESIIAVPMTLGNRILGAILSYSQTHTGLFTSHHMGLLNSVASAAAIAIDNARLFQEEQSRAEQERLVRMITDRIRRGTDREAILRITMEELGQVLEADQSIIRLGTRKQLLQTKESKEPVTIDEFTTDKKGDSNGA